MTLRKGARRARQRWLGLGAAVTAAMLLVAGAVFANLSGSTFEGNDGNLTHSGTTTDWDNVAGLNKGIDKPSGTTDNSFGQGSKEDSADVTVVTGSIPPNKNDLTRFYEASELAGNGDVYLYLGWERAVNIGNANLDFEINKNTTTGFDTDTTGKVTINRTAGDLLVTYDFGGSGTPTLGLNTWLTSGNGDSASDCYNAKSLPCWGNHVALNSSDSEGAVNGANVTDPIAPDAPRTLGTGLFGEAAINLTGAGVFEPGVCEAFGSTFLKSRSSSSFTAELKDFIAPIPVNISNCGTIEIHKVTENGDDTFGFSATGGLDPSSFDLSNGDEQDYANVQPGSYTITEDDVPTGWTLDDLSCTATGSGTSASTDDATVTITMAVGGDVDCTYTNHIKLSPTISTVLSADTIDLGDTLHDSATLSGATATAGGTVTYSAYVGQNTCSGTDLLDDTVNVANGVVPDSADFTPSAAGYYSFQAVYSGDTDNEGATSVCSTEQLLVKTNPSISTILSATSVDVGTAVHDSATLSDATSDAGGTVTYTVYTDSACSADAQTAGTKAVTNGVVLDSDPITFNDAGDYYWQAAYSGDTKNNGATSECTDEHLVVNPLSPSLSTAQNLLPNDTATLSGATSGAGGTITFNLFDPLDATCSGTPAYTETVNVNGNGDYDTTNTDFFATDEGTWRWQVLYSGDGNNDPASSACGVERFTIANS